VTGARIVIRGQIQGVGFRPTVWRLANEMGLVGDVRNTGEGVEIRIWGQGNDLFAARLKAALPALARIDAIELDRLSAPPPGDRFDIVTTRAGAMRAAVTPDAATCADCLAEIRDPGARRFRHPFASCTNCGPRFSIVRAGPYDRANTTMAQFGMCADCAAEYGDPADRRFHAQPIACPACGPRIWLECLTGDAVQADAFSATDAADAVGEMISAGHIVAIKGLGGVHLACDATDAATVRRLRARKRRRGKALALMARDLDVIARFARITEAEAALLQSAAAPIVLLEVRGEALPDAVAPGLDRLGFMLPYTPLHHMILSRLDFPVVMTSGNMSGQPQCTTNGQVRARLATVADFACLHDREIANRIDDSVVRVDLGRPRLLRRARGYAPRSVALPDGFDQARQVLAMGGELKNTFCLVRDGRATLSQHLGDLEDAATAEDVRHNLRLYQELYRHAPDIIAVDAHPDYLSTKHGREIAGDRPVVEVQHHHAHIAACLAENGRALDAGPVLGIVLDGLGLGPDGTIWGGEFLVAEYRDYRRAGCLKPVALPGGTAAVREPWRNAYAHLLAGIGWAELERDFGALAVIRRLAEKPRQTLDAMIRSGLNSPLSSSCGRLFDAAAALAGVAWERQDYEGEAAMLFEAAIDRAAIEDAAAYPFAIRLPGDGVRIIDSRDVWRALLGDLLREVPVGNIAARFHRGLAEVIVQLASQLCHEDDLTTVALSGGCFQNVTLFSLVHEGLAAQGLEVLSHGEVPANDGGLSLGQAAVALAQTQQGGAHVPRHTRPDR